MGEIREHMLPQFPPGLTSLQLPRRDWSAATKLGLCAFDLYSMTITHMKKCLESEGVFGHGSHLSECSYQINGTHFPPSVTPEEVLTLALGAYLMLGDTGHPHDQSTI